MRTIKLMSVVLAVLMVFSLMIPAVSATETQREIPFAIFQECRIQGFNRDVNNELFLVKSPEEMETVIDIIYGNPDDEWESKPVMNEKYTEEFFKNKAVVIGLYTFASGSDRHSIENMYVVGNTLKVSRSVFSPSEGTCDMQYRFALMEVALSDIEGVTKIEDCFPGDVIVADIKSVYGLRGDADYDSVINVKDATQVQKHVASLHMFSATTALMADANMDGDINIKDATEIQKYSVGFSLSSGIGYLVAIYEEYLPDTPDLKQVLEELLETIDYAEEALMTPGSNYVHATEQRLSEEIDKAKALYESENPSYEEVIAQKGALRAAVEGLEYVNLDISELAPLMNEAQQIVDAGGYTEESIDVLIDAMFKGQMACLYGQSQNEVTEAIEDIEAAMKALVPLNSDGEREIAFTILEECRVSGYGFGSSKTELYLVKSVQQMDEILATIENGGFYERPVRDENFNDEYFEEHSLIISLSFVGGGCCSQTIDNLTLEGDTLKLYRTLFKKQNPTPDMNYQYVLIDVKNSDIQGADTIVDGDSDGDIISNPEKNKITIYFENTLEWPDVNVYYWGETAGKNWPGEPMNILCQGLNGYDLYSLEIPADAEGIVFNSPLDSVQTEDVVTLFDEMLCSPSIMSSLDRWSVRVVDINDVNIFPEPPAENEEPTVPPEPASPVEDSIEFIVLQESRVWGWGELYEEEKLEIYLVESADEMDEILCRVRGDALGKLEAKPVRDEKFNAEYFAENSLIIAFVPLGSGSYTQEVQELTIEGDLLTIHTKIYTPSVSTCDMNYRYLLIEVKKEDVEAINDFDYVFDYEWIDVD